MCIPELKGRSLEEIDELFAKRVPAWKFKSFQTTLLADAMQEVKKMDEGGDAAAKVEHVDRVSSTNSQELPSEKSL